MNLVTEKGFVSGSEKQVLIGTRYLRIYRPFRSLLRIDTPKPSVDPLLTLINRILWHHPRKHGKILSIIGVNNMNFVRATRILTIPETAPNADPSSPLSTPNPLNSPKFPSSVT